MSPFELSAQVMAGVPRDDRCLLGDQCSGLGSTEARLLVRGADAEVPLAPTFVSQGAPPLPGVAPCVALGITPGHLRVTDVSPWPRDQRRAPWDLYCVSLRVSRTCDWVAPAP